jgi:hypothetical protein
MPSFSNTSCFSVTTLNSESSIVHMRLSGALREAHSKSSQCDGFILHLLSIDRRKSLVDRVREGQFHILSMIPRILS